MRNRDSNLSRAHLPAAAILAAVILLAIGVSGLPRLHAQANENAFYCGVMQVQLGWGRAEVMRRLGPPSVEWNDPPRLEWLAPSQVGEYQRPCVRLRFDAQGRVTRILASRQLAAGEWRVIRAESADVVDPIE